MYWLPIILFCIAKVNYIHMDVTNNTKLLNFSSNNKFYFCRSLLNYGNHGDSHKAIFHDITGYSQLENIIFKFIEVPLKLIRFNKKLLSKFMKPSGIKEAEFYFHGSLFYQSLEKMFNIFPDEISFEIVDEHLQTLMVSILTYETRSETFGYSASELRQCFQINDYVAQSISIFGDLSVKWLKASSPGFTRYLNLRRMLELTRTILNSGPSKSCNQCLKKLSLGCSIQMNVCI
uniref:SJCHGC02432 protein n=1 Tax=Schistosoma japonicum TaxID=6182 RepID=Q5DD77_SCHJA|nr:SJCHGC02432 protein [Schistosoma japonicum]